jgi:hypothetical protein
LVREVWGNPCRLRSDGAAVSQSWAFERQSILAWNSGTVPALAQSLSEQRAWDQMHLLADALEDAGCTDSLVLDHCRSRGPHVRGCWVVDLILSKDR